MTHPQPSPIADEVAERNRRGPDFAFPMDTAPKDGSILRLLVKFDRKSAAGAFEDTTEPSWTIGTNNMDNTDDDQWDIVGWSWEQDVFCHAYGATAIGWLPFHTESAEPALVSPPKAGEGDPEPVAWRYHYHGWAEGSWQLVESKPGQEYFKAGIVEPLYATQQPRVDGVRVTDEMVARVTAAVKRYTQATLFVDDLREIVRSALASHAPAIGETQPGLSATDETRAAVTSTELVSELQAYVDACSGPGITLYDGHPAVLIAKARDALVERQRELDEARSERDSYERLHLNEIERSSSIDDDLTASQAEVERLKEALRVLDDLLSGEIQERFGHHPSKTTEEVGRNSTIYPLLSVPRDIARAAFQVEESKG